MQSLGTMKSPTCHNKPAITIALHDDQRDVFVPSYTTLDKVQGDVTIVAPYDTSFDQIYITLEASVKTFVEKMATASPTNYRTEAFQVFLRLLQPLNLDAFDGNSLLKAGRTYKFPFTFVIPQKLLPQSCEHVLDAHLNLPPSLGDPMTASLKKTLLDDMAPEMSVISYAIRARITNGRGSTGKPIIMAENSKKIRIVPTVDEEPPLVIYGGLKDDYILRNQKEIKKGLFKSKLGTLTLESAQPKSLRLPALKSNKTCPITTMATVNVRFDPSEESAQPPRLNTLCAKLKASTFFSSVPMSELPSKATESPSDSTRGVFVQTIPLSSRCIASAQWERHDARACDAPPATDGQNSAFSTPSTRATLEPSSAHEAKIFYTSQILVPITLPRSCKVFVPTFHSCLVSRVYSLGLHLSIQSPSPTITNPSVQLKLPIQISAEGNPDASTSTSTREANTITLRGIIGANNARISSPPSPEYSEASLLTIFDIPSPDYSPLDQLCPPGILDEEFGGQAHSAQHHASPAETVSLPSYSGRALWSPGSI